MVRRALGDGVARPVAPVASAVIKPTDAVLTVDAARLTDDRLVSVTRRPPRNGGLEAVLVASAAASVPGAFAAIA